MRPKAGARSEHVRELIEEGIATGSFPPGMRLDEMELAERFNVSRTPLREALFQLASAGIVVMQPRRGTVVAEVTPHRLVEMFEVMGELEALCARLSARRMSALDHQRLLEAHRACQRAAEALDPDAYYYQNEQFHQLIYGNRPNVDSHSSTRCRHSAKPLTDIETDESCNSGSAKTWCEHDGTMKNLAMLAACCCWHRAVHSGLASRERERFKKLVLKSGWRTAWRIFYQGASSVPAFLAR